MAIYKLAKGHGVSFGYTDGLVGSPVLEFDPRDFRQLSDDGETLVIVDPSGFPFGDALLQTVEIEYQPLSNGRTQTRSVTGFDVDDELLFSFTKLALFSDNRGNVTPKAAREALIDGDDRYFGAELRDTVDSGAGDDLLRGFGGGDRFSGGDGDDVLRGDKGRDRLKGDAGSDLIDGGKGRDVLEGGAGGDVFDFNGRFGRDRVLDYGVGRDRIDLSDTGATGFRDLVIRQNGDNAIVKVEGGGVIVLKDFDSDDLGGRDFLF